jgi:serine/threonine protein kinase
MGCMKERFEDEETCSNCGFVEGTAPDSPLYLPPRTILESKYLVGRVLGQGGFGITYLAWDINLNIKLAIKEYFPQDLASRAAGHSQVSAYAGSMGSQYEYGLDKFLQEARTLAQFEGHPNIVSVRDFFKANGTAYFVMSYVEGITVKDHLINSGGVLPVDQARGIIMPVLDALKEVHSVNILHRDISPDNIYINNKGQVILIDFGAARQAIGEKGRSLSIILKPGYAPEEQYRSKGIQGPWTDIYAVGATLYHLITGHQPPEALERLAEDGLVPPTQLGAAVSDAEESAILKALAVKAADRHQTVADFQAGLLGEQLKEGVTAPVPAAAENKGIEDLSAAKKKKPVTIIAAVAAVVVFGIALFALWSGGMLGGSSTTALDNPAPDSGNEEEVVTDPNSGAVNLIGNSNGNIVNGGLAALQGDVVYFRSNEGGSLARGNLSGGGVKVISSDAAWFINVIGEWIYYSNRDDNNRIYKIKTDGSGRATLTDGGSWFVTVVENWIYYISEDDNYQLTKIDLNGDNKTIISEDSAWFINISDGWIYYINRSDGDKIYRIKTDGTEKTAVSGYAACCINVYDGQIYHSNEEDGSKLYSIKIDGSEETALTDHPAWFINVAEGWVYYVNEEDNFTLNKIKPDGSGRVKLTNDSARYVVVIDDWVVFLDYAEEDSTFKVRLDGTDQSYVESGL